MVRARAPSSNPPVAHPLTTALSHSLPPSQPVRAHHCKACGLCVSRFDHHCGCIGVCVGERNHCRFWWFLLAQNAAVLAALDVVSRRHQGRIRSIGPHDKLWTSGMASRSREGFTPQSYPIFSSPRSPPLPNPRTHARTHTQVSAAYNPHFNSLVDFAMANLLYLAMSLLLWVRSILARLFMFLSSLDGGSGRRAGSTDRPHGRVAHDTNRAWRPSPSFSSPCTPSSVRVCVDTNTGAHPFLRTNHPSLPPTNPPFKKALANLTSFECAKGPERVWYLRGTRDCDLPFSQVRTVHFPL